MALNREVFPLPFFENMTKPEVEKVVIDAFGKAPDGATVSYADFVGFVSRARGQLDAAEA